MTQPPREPGAPDPADQPAHADRRPPAPGPTPAPGPAPVPGPVPVSGPVAGGPPRTPSRFWERWALTYLGALLVAIAVFVLPWIIMGLPSDAGLALVFVGVFILAAVIIGFPAAVGGGLVIGLLEWVLRPTRTTPWLIFVAVGAATGVVLVLVSDVDLTLWQGALIGGGGAVAGSQATGPLRAWWLRVLALLVSAVLIGLITVLIGPHGPEFWRAL